jgi:hypothetical protein
MVSEQLERWLDGDGEKTRASGASSQRSCG